jgi:hypothetical protein
MLANGSSLSTVDNLPLDDAKALYVTLQGGLWGPYGDAYKTYATYCAQHLHKEVTVAVAQGKKYKATQPVQFHKMFPIVEDFHTLGEGQAKREKSKRDHIALQMLSVLPSDNAPAWIKELM